MERRTLIVLFLGALCYLVLLVYGIDKVYTEPLNVSNKVIISHPKDEISIAHKEIFGKLERPQVIFNHEKHIKALMKQDHLSYWDTCQKCHVIKKEGSEEVVIFKFPKKISGYGKKAVMNAYHKACIDCHKERLSENRESGPITCGKCHVEKTKNYILKYPKVVFDFKIHEEHEKELEKRTGKKRACYLCHYTYDLKTKRLYYKNGTEESCYYCHNLNQKRVDPELAQILKITRSHGLDVKTTLHRKCINCHLKLRKEIAEKNEKVEKLPPLECIKCHTGKYRTLADLKNVPRPDRGQKKVYFIKVKNAKMKGVPFTHKEHEYYCESCRECHHDRLEACNKCHTIKGSAKGGYVPLAEAYHSVFAKQSCVGCHNRQVMKKDCAGCHKFIHNIDVATNGPRKDTCDKCHTGKKTVVVPKPIFIKPIFASGKVKEDIKINVLEREFQPAKFPHKKIIEKLVEISNKSKLASYFHRIDTVHMRAMPICEGCHHHSKPRAEAKVFNPPSCKSCHPVNFDPSNLDKPRLLAAYHQQCIGCHKAMKLGKAISKCTDCHELKKNRPSPKKILEEKVRLFPPEMIIGSESGEHGEVEHKVEKEEK